MTRFLTWTFVVFGLVYVGIGATLYYFQRSLLFAADRTDVSPASIGLARTDVHRLTAADGVKIVAWVTQGAGTRLAIYFHGNGGSLASRDGPIKDLVNLGFSVLAVEYRGYGGSEGAPSETGFTLDADAAYGFARRLGYLPSQIFLYGESLGTGVAVALAARCEVAGMILDSAYLSIADVAADRYRMFPVRQLIRDPFRSDLLIGRVAAPILMLHGAEDDVVPIESGRKLFALASGDTEFVSIDGANHLVLGEAKAQERIRVWLERLTHPKRDISVRQ